MPNSRAIDNAVIAKLGADAALLALMPNGVYWQVPPDGSTRAVVVSLVDSNDTLVYQSRSHEDVTYMIKAVALGSTPNANADARAAADRIDALLDPQPPSAPATLTVAGYTLMKIEREKDLPRIHETERDQVDTAVIWYHGGAHYRVQMSL